MKLTDDQIEILVYNFLLSSGLKTAITGNVYRTTRPAGAKNEDIVIGVVTLSNNIPQVGSINVNIHVPKVIKTVLGKEQALRNHSRLLALNSIARPILDKFVLQNVSFTTVNQKTFDDVDEADNDFSNYSIDFVVH